MRVIGQAVILTLLLFAASCAAASSTPAPTAPPKAAAKLAFTMQPTGATAGSAFPTQPVVTLLDADGDTVANPPALVTLTVTPGTGTSGPALFGATTIGTTNGVAAFRDLQIDLAGSGYTLTASSRGLTPATSNSFDIAVGAAAQLIFTTQPGGAVSGLAFTTQPVVTIQDAVGNAVTSSAAPVTLAVTPPSDVILSGNTTVNAVNGVAVFKDVSINAGGFGFSLTATSSGMISARSISFSVVIPP